MVILNSSGAVSEFRDKLLCGSMDRLHYHFVNILSCLLLFSGLSLFTSVTWDVSIVVWFNIYLFQQGKPYIRAFEVRGGTTQLQYISANTITRKLQH